MNYEIERITKTKATVIKTIFEKIGMSIETVNERFFQDEHNILLVSYIDEVPTGFLYAYVLEEIHRIRPKIFLYSIDVFPEYQNQGIGKLLVGELLNHATNMNCTTILVLTNDSNFKAKKLYETTGAVRANDDDIMYIYNL